MHNYVEMPHLPPGVPDELARAFRFLTDELNNSFNLTSVVLQGIEDRQDDIEEQIGDGLGKILVDSSDESLDYFDSKVLLDGSSGLEKTIDSVVINGSVYETYTISTQWGALGEMATISSANSIGVTNKFAKIDHSHQGVHQASDGSTISYGDIVFTGTEPITVTNVAGTFTTAAIMAISAADEPRIGSSGTDFGSSNKLIHSDFNLQGVHAIKSYGGSLIYGDIILQGDTGINIGQSDQTITISGSGVGVTKLVKVVSRTVQAAVSTYTVIEVDPTDYSSTIGSNITGVRIEDGNTIYAIPAGTILGPLFESPAGVKWCWPYAIGRST